ncbi:uncharacterized protein LOC114292033 isoform X2 [Camellia sinensis]|uniref:uncharacterized protein LOC114292033 isoform X2 n=1 Tax=Camellia sinensis TaxID=4442 RepID=UPI001036700D|nr:uncharacterized protein LOC114292033 isoform X2 [Camellia sinensis]
MQSILFTPNWVSFLHIVSLCFIDFITSFLKALISNSLHCINSDCIYRELIKFWTHVLRWVQIRFQFDTNASVVVPEMDNNRASRFSPAKPQTIKKSGMDGNGGGIVFSENLKKERLRKLSVVGRVSSSNENGEMGSVGSDREDELRPTTSISKRFKLPTKFFDEYNTVDHASVPRKLRSDKKKPNNGINGVKLPIKNSIKKSKQKQQRDSEGSPSQIIVRPITKDEEEVVETLYALAEMFPFPNNNKSDSDCELTKAKSSPMREGENSRPRLEGSEAPEKEEDSNSKSLGPSTTVEAGNSSLLEESAQETVQAKCLNEPSEPGFPNSAQLRTELDNTISQRNIQSMSMLSKSEPIDGNPSCSSVGCNVQSELGLGTSSKQPKHKEAATYAGKPENAAGPAASVGCQHELQHTLNGSKNSGVALWPGLSSAASNGASTQGPSLRSSPAKTPVWLAMAPSVTPPGSLRNGVLTEKDSRAPVGRNKPWKRCSAHVYVSRLIKVLQITEKKDVLPVLATQLTSNEGSKRGIIFTDNHLNTV